VLFYVSNFQYVITTLSFNTSQPFKQPIYSNKLFMYSLIILLVADISILVVSPSNPVYWWLFHDESFEANGIEYAGYYWVIVTGILINSILTFAAEILVTSCFDRGEREKKDPIETYKTDIEK